MVAGLVLALEEDDAGMAGQPVAERRGGDAAADDDDVGSRVFGGPVGARPAGGVGPRPPGRRRAAEMLYVFESRSHVRGGPRVAPPVSASGFGPTLPEGFDRQQASQ